MVRKRHSTGRSNGNLIVLRLNIARVSGKKKLPGGKPGSLKTLNFRNSAGLSSDWPAEFINQKLNRTMSLEGTGAAFAGVFPVEQSIQSPGLSAKKDWGPGVGWFMMLVASTRT